MNSTAFACKRAHYSCLRLSRALLGGELTPARFDMLYVLLWNEPYDVDQRDLRDLLGVSAPVVSRMLKSLEELGLVSRYPDIEDMRRRIVELTDEGRALIERLAGKIFTTDIDQVALDCALDDPYRPGEPLRREHEGIKLRCLLRRLAAAFHDRATFDYDDPYPPHEPPPILWEAA